MNYNNARTAFRFGASAGGPPLLTLYCLMVTLELFLKEYLKGTGVAFKMNHNIEYLLDIFREHHWPNGCGHPNRARIITMSLTLKRTISQLWCDKPDGSPANVGIHCYPDIRYLRHQVDHGVSADSCKDADLDNAIVCAQQVQLFLRQVTGKVV